MRSQSLILLAGIIIGGFAAYFLTKNLNPCAAGNCYTQPAGDFQKLNGKLALYMVDTYRKAQWTTYQQAHHVNDARSVWYDLKTLKTFIQMIEGSACGSCLDPKPDLGVRLYYATYPDASLWQHFGLDAGPGALPPDYAGRHTVVMVPTYRDANGFDNDFDPAQFDDNPCRPKTMKNVFERKNGPLMVDFLMPSTSRSAQMQNHGGQWPPLTDTRFGPGPVQSQCGLGASFADEVTDRVCP